MHAASTRSAILDVATLQKLGVLSKIIGAPE